MSKKFIISATFAFLLIALALIVGKLWGGGEKTGKENLSPTKQEMGNDLVWFQIPELNIRFQVEKEIADAIWYRRANNDGKGPEGYELYVKENPNPDAASDRNSGDDFASIVQYKQYEGASFTNWIADCSEDTCCPEDLENKGERHLLLKEDNRVICYFETKTKDINEHLGIARNYSFITKKLFDGYFKTVPIEVVQSTLLEQQQESLLPKGIGDISHWKTYQNEEYRFSIKIPGEWKVDAVNYAQAERYFLINPPIDSDNPRPSFDVVVYKPEKTESPREWYEGYFGRLDNYGTVSNDVSINGMKALFVEESIFNGDGDIVYTDISYTFPHNNRMFRLYFRPISSKYSGGQSSNEEYIPIFNQVAHSFTFN